MAPEPVRTARLPEVSEPVVPPPRAKPALAPSVPQLTPVDALRTFRKLVAGWNLREDRAWHMLTGKPATPRKLTEEQGQRVVLLMEIDAAVGSVLANVGAWLVDRNPSPLLAGRSPLDYLTRAGLPGYVSLARVARRWAEM